MVNSYKSINTHASPSEATQDTSTSIVYKDIIRVEAKVNYGRSFTVQIAKAQSCIQDLSRERYQVPGHVIRPRNRLTIWREAPIEIRQFLWYDTCRFFRLTIEHGPEFEQTYCVAILHIGRHAIACYNLST
jgi:hypothetical protein